MSSSFEYAFKILGGNNIPSFECLNGMCVTLIIIQNNNNKIIVLICGAFVVLQTKKTPIFRGKILVLEMEIFINLNWKSKSITIDAVWRIPT